MRHPRKRLAVCFALATCLLAGSLAADPAAAASKVAPPPTTVLADSFNVVAARIVVDKSDHTLMLIDRNGQTFKTYPVSLGQNPVGAKKKQDDQKTPEGEYTINWRQDSKLFHRSLHISYPNKSDRQQARRAGINPGGDLFIHGGSRNPWPDGRHHDWTDGCIAVTDREIDEICSLVRNGTPIVIRP